MRKRKAADLTEFIYSGKALCRQFGVDDRVFRDLRKRFLRLDRDYIFFDHNYLLSLGGVKKVWRRFRTKCDLQACVFTGERKKNGETPLLQDKPSYTSPRTLKITQIPLNPILLLAKEYDYEFPRPVVVRRNDLFVVGQEIKACPDPNKPGYWILVGPYPRWRGDRGPRM